MRAGGAGDGGGRRGKLWRRARWAAAALVLLLPAVAMRFTGEVSWDAADFVFAGILLVAVLFPYELVVRKTRDNVYRAAAGVALAAALLLAWANGAVGLIGSEDNPANAMYGGVLAVGIVGAAVARFHARGMARALFATASATVLVAVIALIGRLGAPVNGPLEIVVPNAFFTALFAGSALLFRKAARERPTAGSEPEGRPRPSGRPNA